MKRIVLSLFLVSSVMAAYAQGGLKVPALSPTARISQDFSTSNIEISYSRPSMRGRKIFGDLVPYGKVWRTGANGATKIKFGEDVELAGNKIKAGEYALYTIPGRDQWEIVINKGTGNWGANGYDRSEDLARFTVKASHFEGDCQTFTIMISDITLNSCKIEIVWESTRVVIPVKSNNAETIEMSIQNAINHPPQKPYFQAANYYYETNQKMDLAKAYVDSALEANPKAFYMWYLKARIERKLGNKDAAVAAAKTSIEMAKGTPNEDEYKHNNQKIIDDINRHAPRKQDMD